MPTFEIDVRNKAEITSLLDKYGKEVQKSFLLYVGQDTERLWRVEATGTKRHKGEYRNSFKRETSTNSVSVFTDVEWAKYVEEGRGPITASSGKALHFFTTDGTEVFAKSVGPYEGRHDIPKVISQVEGRIQGLFEKACNEYDR